MAKVTLHGEGTGKLKVAHQEQLQTKKLYKNTFLLPLPS